jgi:Cu(I)/Ag(I) efflux system membrane fusion protein
MHTIHSFKILLAAGVLAVASVGFTACDSSTNQSASENHQGHEGSSAKEAVAVEVPDYAQAGAPLKAPLTEMYNHYLHLKDALVTAKADEAKAAAGALLGALGKTDASALSGEQKTFFDQHAGMIRQHAEAIAGGSDLEAQRGQLDMLSTSAYSLLKAFGANDQTLYYQHCPMANNDKGGNWISQTSEIKNPYFGDKMLKCGETKETLASN